MIPLVTASEQGKAQTENLVQLILNPNCSLSSSILLRCGLPQKRLGSGAFEVIFKGKGALIKRSLERDGIEGETPV